MKCAITNCKAEAEWEFDVGGVSQTVCGGCYGRMAIQVLEEAVAVEKKNGTVFVKAMRDSQQAEKHDIELLIGKSPKVVDPPCRITSARAVLAFSKLCQQQKLNKVQLMITAHLLIRILYLAVCESEKRLKESN